MIFMIGEGEKNPVSLSWTGMMRTVFLWEIRSGSILVCCAASATMRMVAWCTPRCAQNSCRTPSGDLDRKIFSALS